jgi:hypothetical protein
MTLLERYRRWGEAVMRVFRFDLQTHFFWGFVLTLPGVYWPPLCLTGVVVSLAKEGLDLWSKERWCWDDVCLGVAGSAAALVFLYSVGLLAR